MTLYMHKGRKYVRYYKNGEYQDHSRMIYETVPEVGDYIHPFLGTLDGRAVQSNWKVLDVKFPEDDPCMEIYYEDCGTINSEWPCKIITKRTNPL